MTQKAKNNVEYTIATHVAEKMFLSRETIAMCERIADGHTSGDAAVAEILRRYGIESGRANV